MDEAYGNMAVMTAAQLQVDTARASFVGLQHVSFATLQLCSMHTALVQVPSSCADYLCTLGAVCGSGCCCAADDS
jgi:hypothetical protein